MIKKIFFLDTNVLLADPRSLWKFGEHEVVVTLTVLTELDGFKKELSVRGVNARKVSRYLDDLAGQGDLRTGVALNSLDQRVDPSGTGILRVCLDDHQMPQGLDDTADHRILATALAEGEDSSEVVLVTSDINLRIKASMFGLKSEDYRASKSGGSDGYDRPMTTIQLSSEQREVFVLSGQIPWPQGQCHENEYVWLEGESRTLARYRSHKLHRLEDRVVEVWGVSARNPEQHCAVSALLDDQIRLVTLTGQAGSGKTLLAMACGLAKTTDEDEYHKLLCSRPIFPMGQDIGYLPGDINDKINPWMKPIYDSLEYLASGGGGGAMLSSVKELFHQNMVAVEPLTYIRGRSLSCHYFVVDEAQNLSSHELKAIITRAGKGTKIVLTGDPEQIDVPYLDRDNNGLVYVAEKFRSSHISAHIHLNTGERSELAEQACEYL